MTYLIKRINSSPDWRTIPKLTIDNVLWTVDAGIRAKGQLCYNDENLFVHMCAIENNIRAVYNEPLSPVHEDSCLEFFFMLNDTDNYFNFEINPNGSMCIQFGPDRFERICIVRRDAADYFDIHTCRLEDGWEVFYKIPLKMIRLFYPHYSFRGEISGNMYKCGDKTASPHFLSWTPIDLKKPDFHCPGFFGKMHFE